MMKARELMNTLFGWMAMKLNSDKFDVTDIEDAAIRAEDALDDYVKAKIEEERSSRQQAW